MKILNSAEMINPRTQRPFLMIMVAVLTFFTAFISWRAERLEASLDEMSF